MAELWVEKDSFLNRVVTANEKYIVSEPGLRFYAGPEAVVLVGSPRKMYKVCHIRFTRIGGILIQAPYFHASKGVIGQLNFRPEGTKATASFEPGWARATSHRVKLHHPPDGRAHFSQTGKITNDIRRQTFPLSTGRGFVFQLNLYGVEAHEYVAPGVQLPKGRIHLTFHFDGEIPDALIVFGEWLSKEQFRSPIIGTPNGPLTTYQDAGGAEAKAFLLGQPLGMPFQDALLRVTCGRAPSILRDEVPLAVLQAAWGPVGDEACLAFLYPVTDHERMVARLGSIDWDKPRVT